MKRLGNLTPALLLLLVLPALALLAAPSTGQAQQHANSVIVVNPLTSPVPTLGVEPREAIQSGAATNVTGTDRLTLFTVPAGKRLVIEWVSAAVSPDGTGFASLQINTSVGGQVVKHFITLASGGVNGPWGQAGQVTRIYAGLNTFVFADVVSGGAAIMLSGYLVDS